METEVRRLEEDVAEIKKVLASPESCPSPRKQRFKVGPSRGGAAVVAGATFSADVLPEWVSDGGAEGRLHEGHRGSDPEVQTRPGASRERRGDSDRLHCRRPAPDSTAGPGEGPALRPPISPTGFTVV